MQKSALLAIQQEVQRHDFSHFVENPPSVAESGKGVVVSGCPACPVWLQRARIWPCRREGTGALPVKWVRAAWVRSTTRGRDSFSGKSKAPGMHPDDTRMDALWERCAELGMPISLHVADPIWMYQTMDKTNDGLMNAYHWRLDNKPNIVSLSGMIDILDRTLARHRTTTFIACHFANLDYDLSRLGEMFERNSNLYADISARYVETAPIPRFASKFY